MDTPTADDMHPTKPAKTIPARVRVVAKIRGTLNNSEAQSLSGAVSVPWISVNKPKGHESRSVTVTFGDQSASRKESYELDFCYEQHEGNAVVFEREVRPLITGVFNGCNATVIASGGRGSGKSYLIQGTTDELGLATLAVAEMLRTAEGNGNVIAISCYEANSDHVFDILGLSQREVSIWGNGQGNIQLKGLSRVAVTSMSEFQKLFNSERGKSKPVQKTMMELSSRSHRGLIVYVLTQGEKLVGKMNFVDLAGYEDQRRKSSDGSSFMENAKINKSIYALHNVLYSLSANEAHVRYRETKLTHMLQDSLGGASKILMVTCLNSSFCQDCICMVSLASRSCQSTIKGVPSSTKKPSSLTRSVFGSHKSQMLRGASTTTRKQIVDRMHSEKKATNMSSALKVRKLFGEAKPMNSEKENSLPVSLEHVNPICVVEAGPITNTKPEEIGILAKENSLLISLEDANPICVVEACPTTNAKPKEIATLDQDAMLHDEKENPIKVTPLNSSLLEEGKDIKEKNKGSPLDEGGSPPISARLQELSNHLKSLYSSTPSYVGTQPKIDTQTSIDFVEPRTPDQSRRTHDGLEVIDYRSPWQTFSAHGSRAKNSLVQEYLNFLNTASKEDLKKLKGIGEKRATYILELRENSPEPFKQLDDLQNIGLSGKQITRMMKKEVGELFN